MRVIDNDTELFNIEKIMLFTVPLVFSVISFFFLKSLISASAAARSGDMPVSKETDRPHKE